MSSHSHYASRTIPDVLTPKSSSRARKRPSTLEKIADFFLWTVITIAVLGLAYLFVDYCFGRIDRADTIHEKEMRQAAQAQRGPDLTNGVLDNSDHNHATVHVIVNQKKP